MASKKACAPNAQTTKKWKWMDEMLKDLLTYIKEFKI